MVRRRWARWWPWLLALIIVIAPTLDCLFRRNPVSQGPLPENSSFSQVPGSLTVMVKQRLEDVYWQSLTISLGHVSKGPSVGIPSPLPSATWWESTKLRLLKDGDYWLPKVEGYFYEGPFLKNPARKLAAAGVVRVVDVLEERKGLVIMDLESSQIRVFKDYENEGIVRGLAWSPSGKFLAVLRSSGRTSFCLFEMPAALSGHPVGITDYYLDVFNLDGNTLATVKVISRITSGYVQVVWTE